MIHYRRATSSDVDALTRLRVAMQREVAGAGRSSEDDALTAALDRALRAYFAQGLAGGSFVAHVGETSDNENDAAPPGDRPRSIVACCGMVVLTTPPNWGNLTGREAYVMNMYTAPPLRGRGIATELIRRLLADARAASVDRVSLHAHPPARPL